MLPHMYSTIIWLQNTEGADQEYSQVLAHNIFQATDQMYYSTSIFQFSILDDTLEQKYLSIYDVKLNAGRTSFTVSLKFFEDHLGANQQTVYTKLGISLFLLGSSFDGQNGYVESSFVYPRNGILRDVSYSNTQYPVAQFDFATLKQQSPFNYLPSTQYSGKCGMIKQTSNSNKIISVSGCSYFRFYTFVTGFTISSQGSANQIEFGSIVVQSNDPATMTPNQHAQTSGQNSIFKQSPTDNNVGLWINYLSRIDTGEQYLNYNSQLDVKRLQLSFVFVGIRSFNDQLGSSFDYPVQHIYRRDDFIHYSSVTKYTQSGVSPNVVYMPQGSGILPLISQLYPENNGVASISYDDTKGVGFGHAFCGLEALEVQNSRNTFDITLSGQNQNIVLEGDVKASFQCTFFRKRSPCDGTPGLLSPYSGLNGYSIEGSNFDINIQIDTLQNGLGGYKFNLNQLPQISISQGFIKTTYDRSSSSSSIFKIHLNVDIDAVISNSYRESFKIIAFGKQIFMASLTDSNDYINIFGSSNPSQLEFVVYSPNPIQNQIEIVYLATQNYQILSFQIAVQQYFYQLNGIQCVQTCPDVSGSSIGVDLSTNPPTCIYCKESQKLQPNYKNGGCSCLKGYYYDSTQNSCTVCSTGIILCKYCNQDSPSVCSSCTQNAQAIYSGITIINCQCVEGFYLSGKQCLPCPFGCKKCSSETSCSQCYPNINQNNQTTRSPPTCQCQSGYFNDGQSYICQSCSARCMTCQNSANQCTACNEQALFFLNGMNCQCRIGYYQLITGESASCEKCDSSCLTCRLSSLYCQTCSFDDFRQLAGRIDGTKRCDCIEGFIEVQGICIDKSCKSVDPFCQTCAYNPITAKSQCLSCGGNRYVSVQQCKCVCKSGYYPVGLGQAQACQKCAPGCKKCGIKNGQLRCFECAERARLNDDASCTCPQGTIVVQAVSNSFCKTCSHNCLSCIDIPEKCTACASGFILQNNKCICSKGTYLSSSRSKCLPCMQNCDICQITEHGNLQCLKCATDYVYNGVLCALSCSNGKYNGGSVCFQCPQQCTSCLTKSLCLSCEDNFYLFAGSCRSSCPTGTLSVNKQCLLCLQPCASCTNQPTSCNSCINGYLFFNGKCIKDCPQSTYFGDSSCLACSPKCKTCSGSSTNCISCASTQFLFNNDCFDICPAIQINGICTDRCPDGKFYSDSRCLNCEAKCQTCKGSSSNCTLCADNFINYKGNCINQCPKGTFKNIQTCLQCDISCQECQDNPYKCSKCAQGYTYQGNYCVQKCKQGFFKGKDGYCRKCASGCKICTGVYECLQCNDINLTPFNGLCQKKCPSGSRYIEDKCICTFGVLHQQSCLSSCPLGYYVNQKVCKQCNYPCKHCISPQYCTSCADGFTLTEQNSCIRTNKCHYGQIYENSRCIKACSGNLVLHKNCCIYECPVGFQSNNHGGCIEKSVPSVCPLNKFQDGSSCVEVCGFGYFGNYDTRLCQKCSIGCSLCLSSYFCIKCEQNYIFLNGKCIQKMECSQNQIQFEGICYQRCPVGTYPHGQSCFKICPKGTYFWQSFCFETCPTNYYTLYACMDHCPNNYQAHSKICKYKKNHQW